MSHVRADGMNAYTQLGGLAIGEKSWGLGQLRIPKSPQRLLLGHSKDTS